MKRLCVLFVLMGGIWSPLVARPDRTASADDATVSVVAETPVLTVVSVTSVVPSLVPPVIHRERSPIAVSTQPPPTSSLPSPVPSSTPAPVPVASAPAAPVEGPIYNPSPAELRLDAALRWGKHVPFSVRRWAYLVVPAARRYHVDPNLVAAVITMESGGDPGAWNSGSDARGLMQVLHGPFDPAQNIDAGTRMLAGFLRQFHDLSLALAAYNAGPGAVRQYGGIPPYRETRDYVIIVTYLYDLYSHRSLNATRRELFKATVRDLHRFADQRKKIKLLASTAGVISNTAPVCTQSAPCVANFDERVFPTMDPFWPMPGPPDPLQHVGTSVQTP